METIKKAADLNRRLRDLLVWSEEDQEFPVVLDFNQGMEHPTFKITISKVENDVFVDSKGQKWKRCK